MGLINAALGTAEGILADQWKEYFYCEALPETVLAVKGEKRIGGRSSNRRGSDNIISDGSIIAVADGQCVLIVEQGKVVDVCAQPGEYTYSCSTEPSILTGGLNPENIMAVLVNVGKRFTFGGEAPKDQRVYYFNTKEITGNKFGTANPVPFKVVINEQMGFKLSVDLRMNGVYSYTIDNPLLFYTAVCGNVEQEYTRDRIDAMLKAELIQNLQPALAVLSAQGVSYDQIPAHTKTLVQALNEALVGDWGKRGISVHSMNIGVPSIPEDQRKKITQWEENAMTMNPAVAAARIAGAQADSMVAAANNQGGAVNGFIGVNMAQNAGGMNAADLFQMGAQQQMQQPAPAAPAAPAGWTCECGQADNTGNFCTSCGKAKPAAAEGWTCPACGTVNKGKFCAECGAKKPADALQYRCGKCGWEPADPAHPPKFCPECGDPFDDGDLK